MKLNMAFFSHNQPPQVYSSSQLKLSRAKSCANREQKINLTNSNAKQPNPHEQMIQNLLNRRNYSSKKMFTDQTTYTYKPEISNLPLQLYPETRSQIQISKEKIFQRLVQNMKSKQQNFKLLKLQKQETQFKQSCSFKPQISSTSKAIILSKLKTEGPQSNQHLFERLYKQGLEKKINDQKQYLTAKEKQLTDQHTFQPSINPKSKEILDKETRNVSPIYKRVEQIVEKKRQQQKLIENNKIMQIQKMAHPKIENKKTLEILENNSKYQDNKGNVVKRLLDNYLKQKEQKANNLLKEQKEKMKKQCPFQPSINKNYLLMNASGFDPDQDFLDRQKDFENNTIQNIQTKANQLTPTFKPQINKLSQLICKDRNNESLDDKLNRLNYQPLFEKQAQLEQIQKSLYKQCKFHPQINEISKALQGPLKPHTCKCHPAPQKFSFVPKINQKSRQMVNNKSTEQGNRNRKQELVNKIKMQRQYKQLIECTFQPKIKSLNKYQLKMNQNSTDIVPGVREFVQKRNQAMKKKIEDEKYKQKIFNLQKRYKSKTFTQIHEFKLSHKYNDSSKVRKQLLDEAQQKFRKEYTFKPKIIQSIR